MSYYFIILQKRRDLLVEDKEEDEAGDNEDCHEDGYHLLPVDAGCDGWRAGV